MAMKTSTGEKSRNYIKNDGKMCCMSVLLSSFLFTYTTISSFALSNFKKEDGNVIYLVCLCNKHRSRLSVLLKDLKLLLIKYGYYF